MSKYSGLQLKNNILDLDGEVIPVEKEGKQPTFLTLKQVVRSALTANIKDQQESAVSDEQKFKDYELARDINNLKDEDSIEIDSKQKTRIQSLALKVWGKEIAGYLRDVFEGKVEIINTPIAGTEANN